MREMTEKQLRRQKLRLEAKMEKEQYLELFPPVERYSAKQNDIGDCYFVAGVLISCVANPITYSKLLQMFLFF